MTRRGLISGALNRHEAGRNMGRWCVLPREALLCCCRRLPVTTANRLDEETPKREGAEGGRLTGSTKDSGPMKPGNSVEENTLKIRPNGSTDEKKVSRSRFGYLESVLEIGEAVDER